MDTKQAESAADWKPERRQNGQGGMDAPGAPQTMDGCETVARHEAVRAKESATPFVVEVRQVRESPYRTDRFRPEARVIVTPNLRESGLWSAMPQELTRDLLLLLTFVTANGVIAPTIQQVEAAMSVSTCAVRARMRRLAAFKWGGRPAVTEVPRGSGMDAYAVSPKIAAVRHVEPERNTGYGNELGCRPAGRNAVIAYSRARYARPLAEVERIVEEQLHGSPAKEAAIPDALGALPGGTQAYRDLLAVGVLPEDAERLVTDFGPEAAQRQVAWLPHRNARRPERFVVAAIEGNYDEPPQARQAAEREQCDPHAAAGRDSCDDGNDDQADSEPHPLEQALAAYCEDEANRSAACAGDAVSLEIPPSVARTANDVEGQSDELPGGA